MPRAKRPNPASNRTDLLTPEAPGRQMTAPGQEYGKRTAQAQSQRILPVGTPAAPTPAGPAASVAPAGQQPPPPAHAQPGELPWVGTPGSGGPPTSGLPNSAGPGPETLTGLGSQWYANKMSEQATLQQTLAHLAAQPNASSLVKSLAASAGTRG